MRKILITFVFIVCTNIASAESIKLKSGEVIEGEIVERMEEKIRVDTGVGVPVTYYFDEIDLINKKPLISSLKITELVREISPPGVTVDNVDGGVDQAEDINVEGHVTAESSKEGFRHVNEYVRRIKEFLPEKFPDIEYVSVEKVWLEDKEDSIVTNFIIQIKFRGVVEEISKVSENIHLPKKDVSNKRYKHREKYLKHKELLNEKLKNIDISTNEGKILWTVITDIETNIPLALRIYKLDNRSFPSTEQGLNVLLVKPNTGPHTEGWKGPYLVKEAIDPWGRPYVYISPGLNNPHSYDLCSYGPDGIESKDDFCNWKK